MDLIYTSADRMDQGVLNAYSLDLSYGLEENNFALSISHLNSPSLPFGALIYAEGTEYGGMVDAVATATNTDVAIYSGRTWHGLLNSKVIQPDVGSDYYTASGDANAILATLISRLGLQDMFAVSDDISYIVIDNYQFRRYCRAYDGIRDMLADNGAKLTMTWTDRKVLLSAVPAVSYADEPVDSDMAYLDIERHAARINHLICLGGGNLADRDVIHLYADASGNIGDQQVFTGIEEIADVYDYANAESAEQLRKDGIRRFRELLNVDRAEILLNDSLRYVYDVGDIVGASDVHSGNRVVATVTQKIVRIESGAVRIDYKTGG